MADRTPSDSPMASDRLDTKINAFKAGEKSWTAGLPHDFHGWGPQTPDPAEDHAPNAYASHEGLHWDASDDSDRHIVWRFDRRKHH